MKKKTTSIIIDKEISELIEKIGEGILYTDNASAIIRYCVKFTAKAQRILKED